MLILSSTEDLDQSPNAFLAASTAKSASSMVPSGTEPIISPFVGFSTVNDDSPLEGTQLPLMYSLSLVIMSGPGRHSLITFMEFIANSPHGMAWCCPSIAPLPISP